MENFFAIGLRATFGPRSEAELAFGNPCAGRALSTQWKKCFHTMENFSTDGKFRAPFAKADSVR